MNEILLNILSVVVTTVVLPLISFAGVRLIAFLNAKIKDENARQLLTTATTIVTNSVRLVSQTYVDSLKESGCFNEESHKEAFTKAKNAAISQMSEEVKNYIATTYGDLENWLTTQIESTVYTLKTEVLNNK